MPKGITLVKKGISLNFKMLKRMILIEIDSPALNKRGRFLL
jgi:hypothetical protein